MSEVIRHTPIGGGDFGYWSKRFQDRQEAMGGNEYQNEVEFTFFATPLLNLWSDLHIGHPTTRYKRIEDETNEILGTANSFLILMGDEIDHMHWNPGQMEQQEQTPEQVAFFWAICRELAKYDKLLLRIPGDHDGWMKKQGFRMNDFVRELGANVTSGPTRMIANVEEQQYIAFLAHQLPGMSMYNRNHSQMRNERFGAGRGVDFIASGHTHQKQIAHGFTYGDDGKSRGIDYINLSTYKPTDGWLQKKGYAIQTENPHEMFGVSVMLDGKEHNVYVSHDIVEANKSFRMITGRNKQINRLTPLNRTGYNDEDIDMKWTDWDNFPNESPSENY